MISNKYFISKCNSKQHLQNSKKIVFISMSSDNFGLLIISPLLYLVSSHWMIYVGYFCVCHLLDKSFHFDNPKFEIHNSIENHTINLVYWIRLVVLLRKISSWLLLLLQCSAIANSIFIENQNSSDFTSNTHIYTRKKTKSKSTDCKHFRFVLSLHCKMNKNKFCLLFFSLCKRSTFVSMCSEASPNTILIFRCFILTISVEKIYTIMYNVYVCIDMQQLAMLVVVAFSLLLFFFNSSELFWYVHCALNAYCICFDLNLIFLIINFVLFLLFEWNEFENCVCVCERERDRANCSCMCLCMSVYIHFVVLNFTLKDNPWCEL